MALFTLTSPPPLHHHHSTLTLPPPSHHHHSTLTLSPPSHHHHPHIITTLISSSPSHHQHPHITTLIIIGYIITLVHHLHSSGSLTNGPATTVGLGIKVCAEAIHPCAEAIHPCALHSYKSHPSPDMLSQYMSLQYTLRITD